VEGQEKQAPGSPPNAHRNNGSSPNAGNARRPPSPAAEAASGQAQNAPPRANKQPDRSPSFRPIIGERQLGRVAALRHRPTVKARVARVLVTSRGEIIGYKPDQQPTVGELLWKGPGTLYEIDMGKHWAQLKVDVPSIAEAFLFSAIVDLEWWVKDPIQIVRDGVHDVRETLEPHLRQRLARVTRNYDVADAAQAEEVAARSLRSEPLGPEYGLDTQAFLQLRMDPSSVEHATAVRKITWDIELERKIQVLRLERDDSTAALIQRRLDRYRDILVLGNVDQFALQMAQNPEEIPAVVQMLREERHNDRRAVTDFVTKLLDSGAIDRHEINDQVREALRWLKDATDTVLLGPDDGTRPPRPRSPDALTSGDLPRSDLPEPPVPPPASGP
jgi:hypothetical protein